MELVNQIDETICFNENNIRILGSYNEPWFVVKDICNILEIKDNRSALRIIPDKWKAEQILPTLGGKQITSIVNEAGLYKLIMRSNKPIAQKFQEVVCEDILPSLRKKGEYKIQSIMDRNKELEEEKLRIEKELEEKESLLEIQKEELLEKEVIFEILEEKNAKRIKLLELKNCKKGERVEHGKNVIYVVTNEYLESERTFIVGKAIILANRISQYNKSVEHNVVYYRECNNAKQMSLIEENILYKLDKYRERANRDRFILPEGLCISLFINVVNKACDWFDDVDDDVVVERLTDDKDKEYYEDNKEYIKEYKKQHYEENKEEINKKGKAWYEENKEDVRVYNKKYREENEEKIKAQKAMYKKEHKEEYKERDARYYRENKEEISVKQKLYNEENREKILAQRKEYYNKNLENIRAKDRARNPKVTCECGLSICKRSLPAHRKSKTHEMFMNKKMIKLT
jgi:prophage antirepressor-like protein